MKKEGKPMSNANDGFDGPATGWLGRTFSNARLGGSIVAELAKGKVRQAFSAEDAGALSAETQERIAIAIAEQTGKLKGMAMKIGQMLSYMDHSLPEAARKALEKLQDSTTPMAPALVRSIVERELGKPIGELFASWDDEPFAAASIGQVHRARLHDGTELAVKVQYPDIDKAFASDFKSLGALGAAIDLLVPGGSPLPHIEELRERLTEECDYERELANLEGFRRAFAALPGASFPKPYPALSTKRVLTTAFMRGLRFAEFAAKADQQARDRAARTIYTLTMTAIYKHHFFNGDPHPGNYLFQENGDVVFLDFGCVKHWTPEFVASQKRIVDATLRCDMKRFTEMAIKDLGVLTLKKFDIDALHRACLVIIHSFLYDEPFHFNTAYVAQMTTTLKAGIDPMRQQLPKDMTLVNRLWWGLYSVLANLDASFNGYEIVQPLLYPEGPGYFPIVPRGLVPTAASQPPSPETPRNAASS
jgi:predicted unusual protein kinase regulating ubiquinone biosynthesis (AarF/ABC1/UbiB family)